MLHNIGVARRVVFTEVMSVYVASRVLYLFQFSSVPTKFITIQAAKFWLIQVSECK